MVGLLEYLMENRSLKDLAQAWGVTPEQAALRLRRVPFVVLAHAGVRGGGRGRPGRRLALNPGWRFWDHTGGRPLGTLLEHLRTLHKLGEPFALGIPLTSVLWRPFLHPEVRVLVPPETLSWWKRLFGGEAGGLCVVVDLLPPDAGMVEVENLPVLSEPFAAVDALRGFQRVRNMNVLALADWLAHRSASLDVARSFARDYGLDDDLAYLEDHRRRGRARVLRPREVRRAHRLVEEFSQVPAGTRFEELAQREAFARD